MTSCATAGDGNEGLGGGAGIHEQDRKLEARCSTLKRSSRLKTPTSMKAVGKVKHGFGTWSWGILFEC
jgi:hypothetical protein